MEGYIQAPIQQQAAVVESIDLSRPPKWLKRPVGATFGVSRQINIVLFVSVIIFRTNSYYIYYMVITLALQLTT